MAEKPYLALNTIVLKNIMKKLQEQLIRIQKDNVTATFLIKVGFEVVYNYKELNTHAVRKEYLLKALETIAKGKDGILGTEDDLIPEPVLHQLQTMIDTDMLQGVVQLVSDAFYGKLKVKGSLLERLCPCGGI